MRLLLAVIIVLALGIPPAGALDPGQADGLLIVADSRIPLKHAYATLYGNEEGMLEGPELRILLTDRKVPQTILSGPILDRLDALARDDQVRGVLLRLDPAAPKDSAVSGTLLVAPSEPQASLTFFSTKTTGGQGSFDALDVSGNRVVGQTKLTMPGDDSTESFEYRAGFSAPLFRDEVTSRVKGDEARSHPAAQTMLAWNEAMRKADFSALRELSAADKYQELQAFRTEVGEQAFLLIVASEATPTDQLRQQITEVIVRGDRAFIMMEGDDTRSVAMASRQGERWVID